MWLPLIVIMLIFWLFLIQSEIYDLSKFSGDAKDAKVFSSQLYCITDLYLSIIIQLLFWVILIILLHANFFVLYF